MRTIKFRGKSLQTGEWIKGSYVNVTKDPYIIVEQGTSPIYCHRVDPETVGQFIEKLSKDEDEMYDGDIVEYKNLRIFDLNDYTTICRCICYSYGVIEYNAPGFRIRQISGDNMSFYDYTGDNFSWEELRVVGNIHDNKEFLEGVI